MSDSYFPATFSLDEGAVTAVESSTANPKTRLDSTGFFVTDSSGNILAKIDPNTGLDLIADSTASPDPRRKVQWLAKADGSVVAEIQSRYSAAVGSNILEATADMSAAQVGSNPNFNSLAGIGVRDLRQASSAGKIAMLNVSASSSGAPDINSRVSAQVWGNSRTILDGNNNSDFLSKPTIQIWGPAAVGWATGSPGAFSGIQFSGPNGGSTRGLLFASSTCYVPATTNGASMNYWWNSQVVASPFLRANNPAGVRLSLPAILIPVTVNAGANYLWQQLTGGASDGNDFGFAALIY
jgi:hypothetical protein